MMKNELKALRAAEVAVDAAQNNLNTLEAPKAALLAEIDHLEKHAAHLAAAVPADVDAVEAVETKKAARRRVLTALENQIEAARAKLERARAERTKRAGAARRADLMRLAGEMRALVGGEDYAVMLETVKAIDDAARKIATEFETKFRPVRGRLLGRIWPGDIVEMVGAVEGPARTLAEAVARLEALRESPMR
jgi:septal ring factor EnvC (AmiA/AmiB activator)